MILGIDASNIRAGGGIIHLAELLKAAEPNVHGISKVIIWSGRKTLDSINDQEWLDKQYDSMLDKNLFYRLWWSKKVLRKKIIENNVNLLFVPGGTDNSGFSPMVSMSQNLLPFEWNEIKRYGISMIMLKNIFLRISQSRTFKKADGMIFLTPYAFKAALKITGELPGKVKIIPHGINERFFRLPKLRNFKKPESFTSQNPCNLLYVSVVEMYKHQWCVVEAIKLLIHQGISVKLDLIGPTGPGSFKLERALQNITSSDVKIEYHGSVPYEKLDHFYNQADIGIFASSCETFGQILTESMAAGLPMCCSSLSAMPDILGSSGVYFNPENPIEIAEAIKEMYNNAELREKYAHEAYNKALSYSWRKCADDTLGFFKNVFETNISKN